MGEGERKLCLAELPLELTEEAPLQVQVQLLEEVEDREALAAEEEAEALAEADTKTLKILFILHQGMEASVELVAMEAVAEEAAEEATLGLLAAIVQE